MKHLLLTIIALVFVSSTAYYALGHESRARAEQMQSEVARLRAENDALAHKRDALARRVVALKQDPRLSERRAREMGGLARPHELIFAFEEQRGHAPIEVMLEVSPKRITLAGAPVSLSSLDEELDRLRERLPHARVEVVFDETLGPIARQRIEDIVGSHRSEAPSAPPLDATGDHP